ncbi:histidyl-tRNA synthetase [Encephalitozoon intestinalis ATCC 50506]|uniref:histidine--tRNA ligase n=1 Tax=Encephalitozoon intestinalis (strain ATCC 50506) TaxID=876142 RepID=E0S7I3_ENCIT|nr:histidyl-tRNA synthetase [Encephalitozoon intestinalis ATCC 50506]ADM11662.1 histidyl-tRNA synthetase [Encephalitozoon intestinalis ATCC 50506]UTX45399.1 histidyl-tRNA synthetase [Encephalitozoon intestinalis]
MISLKTPKGTADEPPRQCFLYEEIIEKIRTVFVLYGAVPISTPTFEMKSILTNKYGEDTKLIYDLKDQGGEICALRYDLTVPFARYLASNRIRRMKRYQIGRVYRRDQPSIVRGRLREFVQADFDIAGECVQMMADAEVVSCVDRILREFGIGEFRIKINDRRILTSILEVAGVGYESYGTICSTIDKIEKMKWEDIEREFIQKGLNEDQVKTIKKYIELVGKEDILGLLKEDAVYKIERCKAAIHDMEELFRLCRILGCSRSLVMDVSLARGLDYYTGMILEAEYLGKAVGSVIGGGRYDNLTENLGERCATIPCVGFSVGVSRIFSLLNEEYTKESSTMVYVGASGGLFLDERLATLKVLLDAGIPSETFYTRRSSFESQQKYAMGKKIPFIVVIGESEMLANSVQVFETATKKKEIVKREEMISYLFRLLKDARSPDASQER